MILCMHGLPRCRKGFNRPLSSSRVLALALGHDLIDPFDDVFDHTLWSDLYLKTRWYGMDLDAGDGVACDLLDLFLLFRCPL